MMMYLVSSYPYLLKRTDSYIDRKGSLTFIRRGSFANSGQESMCFFKSRSRYSKTRYNRLSLCTTSCNLSPNNCYLLYNLAEYKLKYMHMISIHFKLTNFQNIPLSKKAEYLNYGVGEKHKMFGCQFVTNFLVKRSTTKKSSWKTKNS